MLKPNFPLESKRGVIGGIQGNQDFAILRYLNELPEGDLRNVLQVACEFDDDPDFQRTPGGTNPQNVMRHAIKAAIAELTYEMTDDERG